MRLPGFVSKEWKKITDRSSKNYSISLTEIKHFLRDCFLFLVDVKTVGDVASCRFFLTPECFYSLCRKKENKENIIAPLTGLVIEKIEIYGWKEQTIKKEKYTVIAAIISVRNKGDWNIFDYDVQLIRPVGDHTDDGMWINEDRDWKINRFEAKKD